MTDTHTLPLTKALWHKARYNPRIWREKLITKERECLTAFQAYRDATPKEDPYDPQFQWCYDHIDALGEQNPSIQHLVRGLTFSFGPEEALTRENAYQTLESLFEDRWNRLRKQNTKEPSFIPLLTPQMPDEEDRDYELRTEEHKSNVRKLKRTDIIEVCHGTDETTAKRLQQYGIDNTFPIMRQHYIERPEQRVLPTYGTYVSNDINVCRLFGNHILTFPVTAAQLQQSPFFVSSALKYIDNRYRDTDMPSVVYGLTDVTHSEKQALLLGNVPPNVIHRKLAVGNPRL